MLPYIFSLLLFLIPTAITVHTRRYDGTGPYLIGVWLISAVISFAVGLIVTAIAASSVPASSYTAGSQPLAALSTGSETSGSFFLGSGTIDEEPSYTYIVQESDGALFLKSMSAEDVAVYEDASPSTATLSYEIEIVDNWWLHFRPFERRMVNYEFHIPAGSVTRDFTVSTSN